MTARLLVAGVLQVVLVVSLRGPGNCEHYQKVPIFQQRPLQEDVVNNYQQFITPGGIIAFAPYRRIR